MVQLKTKRAALTLYAVLLVLPTLVLGLLHWYQLALDHAAEMDSVPKRADDAALRLVETVHDQLARLVAAEEHRPFYLYGDVYVPEKTRGEELVLVDSPLIASERPRGIEGWFSYDLREGPGADVELFFGREDESPEAVAHRSEVREAAESFADRNALYGARFSRIGQIQTVDLPLLAAVVNRNEGERLACVQACAELMRDEVLTVSYSQFNLQYYREHDSGTPRVVATRRVMLSQPLHHLNEEIQCLGPIADGFGLVQGFFIDPSWLFGELPAQVAKQVLSGSERFLPMEEARIKYQGEEYQAEIWMVSELGLDTDTPEDEFYGLMKVAIDMGALKSHFRSQSWRFLGVAAMLALSLGTGMVLLLRSVTLELEQAGRTENFVAAVTHELRTPLSAIRLHGEMLLEGWAKDPEKQREYHRRILRETERLSMLVERVLEKAKLSSRAVRPEPGDLTTSVERLSHELAHRGARDGSDLEFDLARGLPPVQLTQEALAGILVNLVENARKYAPVLPGDPSTGPIRVRTARRGGRVVLEVSDRGPGVPESEREKVFEAFYRAGNESTRTTQGTGLGLHLVRLHAESIGASVSVHENPGGGALFRVRFAS